MDILSLFGDLTTNYCFRGGVAFSLITHQSIQEHEDVDILIKEFYTFSRFKEEILSKWPGSLEEGSYDYSNPSLPRKKLVYVEGVDELEIDVLITEEYYLNIQQRSISGRMYNLPSKADLIAEILLALSRPVIGIDIDNNLPKGIQLVKRLNKLVEQIVYKSIIVALNNQLKHQNAYYKCDWTIYKVIRNSYESVNELIRSNQEIMDLQLSEFFINLGKGLVGYTEMDVVEFFDKEESYGCFSNFSNHQVTFEGNQWKTAEHCYQAQKFLNSNLRDLVKSQPSPKKAAEIGRNNSSYLRVDWDFIKVIKMFNIVKAKVIQNDDVYITLLSTYPKRIIEKNHKDSFWGIGSKKNGANTLGKIFMSIRNEII